MTVKEKAKPKTIIKKKPAKKAVAKAINKFFEGVGRRKTAVARVRLFPGGEDKFLISGDIPKFNFVINKKDFKQYFPTLALQRMAESSLTKIKYPDSLTIEVKASGGGINAQAEAVRLGISRAFVKINPDNLKKLRKLGYLTRDPRMRERKKFGLKRARRAPQWKKR